MTASQANSQDPGMQLPCPVCRSEEQVKLSWKITDKRTSLSASCSKCRNHIKFVRQEPPWTDHAPPKIQGGQQAKLFVDQATEENKDSGGDAS